MTSLANIDRNKQEALLRYDALIKSVMAINQEDVTYLLNNAQVISAVKNINLNDPLFAQAIRNYYANSTRDESKEQIDKVEPIAMARFCQRIRNAAEGNIHEIAINNVFNSDTPEAPLTADGVKKMRDAMFVLAASDDKIIAYNAKTNDEKIATHFALQPNIAAAKEFTRLMNGAAAPDPERTYGIIHGVVEHERMIQSLQNGQDIKPYSKMPVVPPPLKLVPPEPEAPEEHEEPTIPVNGINPLRLAEFIKAQGALAAAK